MKRIYIIILIAICGITAMAQNRPDMTHQSTGRDRDGIVTADQPTLVYDNVTKIISVYGHNSEYYNLTITSRATRLVVFTDELNGEYDIIDASIMFLGAYDIDLTSSRGNTYQWTFDQELLGYGTPIVIDRIVDFTDRVFDLNKPMYQY